MRRVLVTGGSGFLGAALVRKLLHAGHHVCVLDDNSRGRTRRLADVADSVEFIIGDVRDYDTVRRAAAGSDWIFHLAFINGTRFFYEQPDLVLDVGVKGAMNTAEAAAALGIERYILASSSEVYQEPAIIPTPELVPLVVPDVANPRYSYGGGKIISELIALHYLRRRGVEVIIFRPHNVYGPDMGAEHVVPAFAIRLRKLLERHEGTPETIRFEIQGDGTETRAFCYVTDAADGIALVAERGSDGEIYHVGVDHEVTIASVAERVADAFGVRLELVRTARPPGSTPRRCPDISKLRALGFAPRVMLDEGVRHTVDWYRTAPIETNSLQPS